MSVPAVNISELDGAIGQVSTAVKPMVVMGDSTTGDVDTPTPVSRVTTLTSTFGRGRAVETAARIIDTLNLPVVFVRTGSTTAGSYQDVTGGGIDEALVVGGGTSVVTVDNLVEPQDDLQVLVTFVTGGTIGVTGITYRYSFDGGRTQSGVQALGTATEIVLPEGGITFEFAAGTVLAGQTCYCETRGPAPNATEVGTAFDAISVYPSGSFGDICVAFPVSATLFDTIETKMASLAAAGKPRAWFGNFRIPNYGESDATYQAAFNTAMGAKATTRGCLSAGSAEIVSGVSSRSYVQPVNVHVAAVHAGIKQHINAADVNLGAAIGVNIRDENGNPLYHDEVASPGLDAMRATTLRTWNSPQGVYINRPRLFSADGSDFYIVPHRRIMDLANEALNAYFTRRLNRHVRVKLSNGTIREEEALEIELGADAVLRALLMADPMVSGGGFSRGRFVQLSRSDNLLTSKTLTGQARIVPLAYPEFINIDLGFFNPALRTTT